MDEANTQVPARWTGALLVGCRLLVGTVFLVAGVPKIHDYQGMVNAMNAYEVLSAGIISPLAYLLPILEVFAGALLVLGLFTRFTGVLASSMLVVFLIGLVQAKSRGLEIDCGCFAIGSSISRKGIPWWDIVRDVGFLAASAFAIWRPAGPAALDNLIIDEAGDEEVYDDKREDDDGNKCIKANGIPVCPCPTPCSQACTRSGAFAQIPQWAKVPLT